jgi:hypothetical protein
MKIFWYFSFSDLEQTLSIQCVGVLHYPGGNIFCRWAVLVASCNAKWSVEMTDVTEEVKH